MAKNHDDVLNADQAKKIVKEGYDLLAEQYAKVRTLSPNNMKYITMLTEYLPENARVLDLGCGPGVPITKELARHFNVIGVDFSKNQIELARKLVPEAEFQMMDMTIMTFEPESFDCIFSWLAIIHVPREQKAGLFAEVHKILKPDGILLIAIGCNEWISEPGEEFMGIPMYWSEFGAEKSRAMVMEAGFEIIAASTEHCAFNGEDETHYYLMARKSQQSSVFASSEKGEPRFTGK